MIDILVLSMIALSFEKIFYLYVYNKPQKFKQLCAVFFPKKISPTKIFSGFFALFKCIQICVFLYFWHITSGLNIFATDIHYMAFSIGFVLFLLGQFLNFSVFRAIGHVGVFYGKQLGYNVPWVTTFPYSTFKDPQYMGALLSIWGCFMMMNFSYEYWYAIPALETIVYILGGEQEADHSSDASLQCERVQITENGPM